MKLWIRVAWASTTLVIMTLVAVGGLLFLAEKRHLLSSQAEQQIKSVESFSQVCADSTIEENDLFLINYVISLSTGGIRYAYFVNHEGKIKAHNDPSRLNISNPQLKAMVANTTEVVRQIAPHNIEEVLLPVTYQGRKIGVASIGYDQTFFQSQINKTMHDAMIRFLYVSQIVIILGIFGSILFARGVTKPLGELTKATQVIGKGDLHHRIPVNGSDEIGTLGRSFNDMAQKLQELDELKNDFVSSVSHELRSPLTALKGFLQMFQMGLTGPVTDMQKDNLTLMLQCTERLGKFVNNILDVAKLEAGMVDFNIVSLDPKAVAQEIVSFYQAQAQAEKIKVYLDAPPKVSNVMADSDKLKQVFTNLINNALKFTPEGGQVKVWLKEDAQFVRMGVTDTGVGIPRDAVGKLFNKFEQVKATKEKAKTKGSGLGLAIVKQIVEGMGGKISVDSELNRGTTFYFHLSKIRQKTAVAA